MTAPTNDQRSTRPDPEMVARRVNGSVAADRQAQELRAQYARERMAPDPQDIFRRLEAIEAAIYQLHAQIVGSAP